MSPRRCAFIFVVTTFLFTQTAKADCVNPPGVAGEQFYNGTHKVMQFCDGTTWWAMKSGGGLPSCATGETIVMTGSGWGCAGGGDGCTAPASCTSVGDVCSDGSIFAGFVVYNNSSCEPLYVTDNNQSTASQWKNAGGTDDISTNDPVDGQVNHANRGGALSDFPAFDLCESNTYHGKTDWYLPARAELNLLWLNQTAINANAAGNFTTSGYWSSTEDDDTNDAWAQNLGGAGQNHDPKTSAYDVRCVRRD